MKILHLANYYSGSTVYKNLFTALDRKKVTQRIFNAVRSRNAIGKNDMAFETDDSKIHYSKILDRYTMLNFYEKVRRIVRDVEEKQDLSTFDVIHAHTWFSDGAAAYELNRKYHMPYIITIRNTDLNIFYKYMVHLRGYANKILQNASKIIFITPVYKKRLLSRLSLNFDDKVLVIPNGIEAFWLENVVPKDQVAEIPYKIIYVGGFTKGKNVARLIEAVSLLRSQDINTELTIIGAGGSEERKIRKLAMTMPWVKFLGRIDDKKQLSQQLRKNHVFAMPSKSETFGLVYIEALSQGLPILFTANEGIDGMFPSNVGESVDYKSVESIVTGLKGLFKNYQSYDFEINNILENHNWDNIAAKYLAIYKDLINERKT